MPHIVLASKSPRRHELLRRMGITDFSVVVPDVEETYPEGLAPQEIVAHIARLKREEVARVREVEPQRAGGGVVQVENVADVAHKNGFKQAVIERNVHIAHLFCAETADGFGAADHAEDEIVLLGDAIVGHAGVDGLDAGEGFCALQQIGQPAEHALGLLRRGIGNLGKRAERGHIGEGAAVELAGVQRHLLPEYDVPRRLQRVKRQPERCGDVVDGAGRDVAERGRIGELNQAGDGLVECAVAAGGDDQVVAGALARDHLCDLARAGGGVDADGTAAAAERLQNRQKLRPDPGVAGVRIDEKQNFLHDGILRHGAAHPAAVVLQA